MYVACLSVCRILDDQNLKYFVEKTSTCKELVIRVKLLLVKERVRSAQKAIFEMLLYQYLNKIIFKNSKL